MVLILKSSKAKEKIILRPTVNADYLQKVNAYLKCNPLYFIVNINILIKQGLRNIAVSPDDVTIM